MDDFMDIFACNAKKTIAEGYYTIPIECKHKPLSLKKTVLEFSRAPVITEIKFASPTFGIIREGVDVELLASRMQSGGAIAISVLTEPKRFLGSLSTFIKVRRKVEIPLLMKDIFLSRIQIDAASFIGADAILLIKALFDRGYCECNATDMIKYAHSKGIEVLLETHIEDEFLSALNTDADLIGINNRDLRTLKVDLNTTWKILQKVNPEGKLVVSESGIKNPSDIRFLHSSGAHAFLIGSSIMMADNPKKKTEEFVSAL